MTLGRLKLALFGGLGLAGTAVAALLVFAPGTLGPAGDSIRRVAAVLPPSLVWAAVGLLGVLVAWQIRGRRSTGTVFDGATATMPEAVTGTDGELAGSDRDSSVELAIADRQNGFSTLTDSLCATAVASYELDTGVELAAAEAAVADGAWTDDPVAAATLGPDVPQPILARLRLWLDPESERERRLRRTVDAIRRLQGGRD